MIWAALDAKEYLGFRNPLSVAQSAKLVTLVEGIPQSDTAAESAGGIDGR
jgi:hypothetical protein